MILFFDTETTGFVDKSALLNDPAQPHLVQLGMSLTDENGKSAMEMKALVCPEPGREFTIPKAAYEAHGITVDDCEKGGIILEDVMNVFNDALHKADKLVAHNIEFDIMIVEIARHRCKMNPFPKLQQMCTMKSSTNICKLPHKSGRGGSYKWPKLQEAYKHFFGEEFDCAHDAMADVTACRRVYFHLMEQGAIA